MFGIMKDKALSQGAKIAINRQIESYGKVQSLYLDSQKKSIELEVLLHGELEAFKVHVNHYDLAETDGHHQLKVNGVTTSRTWVTALASAHIEGKIFNVPSKYGKMLQTVIS